MSAGNFIQSSEQIAQSKIFKMSPTLRENPSQVPLVLLEQFKKRENLTQGEGDEYLSGYSFFKMMHKIALLIR